MANAGARGRPTAPLVLSAEDWGDKFVVTVLLGPASQPDKCRMIRRLSTNCVIVNSFYLYLPATNVTVRPSS
jgi:hypothetical protein